MSYEHFLFGSTLLDAGQVKQLTVRQIAFVVPMTCDLLRDYYGYVCEHR